MAAATDRPDQERTGPGGPVPLDVPRHNRLEAANRDGRHERWPVEIRQTCKIRHQVQVRPSIAIQLAPACSEGLGHTRHHQTVPSGSCEFGQSTLFSHYLSVCIYIYVDLALCEVCAVLSFC